eukprot:comp23027_c0_seq1/m.36795 comp23027_c0_seq1/g.36795  ORF comp23027_c0_seq1/g.36795 comp23027_c0_seq1/m.36795 type:complete len:493 (-) comp23027_c0_seq1:71-1549(-)
MAAADMGSEPRAPSEGTEEARAQAEAKKNEGNAMFQKGHWTEAADLYSEAISLNPFVAAYWTNRAFAYLKSEAYGYALIDANKAIELDKTFVKGYYRRATTNFALNKYKESLKDFKTVVKLAPKDKDAQAKYKECDRIVMRLMFTEAISREAGSVADTLDLDSMAVEPDYDGPHLPEGAMTVQFVQELTEHFRKERRLHKKYAYQILVRIKQYFEKQPSLVDVPVGKGQKFTICGDIHGQFYDLLHIFDINGLPSETNPYLFNGDFVDRGSFSFEVILLLFSYKLLYPNHFFMARGNHESVNMNKMYGFDGEAKTKGSDTMVELFHEVFRTLPLAHCVAGKILAVHGGLFSKDGVTLDDIRKVDRFREPPDSGLMCEMLWADPMPVKGRAPSKRGVGLHFGPDVTEAFCANNNLDYVVRSHEVKENGYEIHHGGKCITVFSAPNYCDQMGNKGAFITITGDDTTPKFTTYNAVPHPNIKPMAYASGMGFLGL